MMRTIRLARIILAAVAAILMGLEAVPAEPSETLARSGTAPVELGAAPVAVQLVTPAPGETLSARAAAAGRRIYLVFKGLATDEPPDTVYQIYFGLPPGTAPAPDGQYYQRRRVVVAAGCACCTACEKGSAACWTAACWAASRARRAA